MFPRILGLRHALGRVEGSQLIRVELVLHDVAGFLDPPQPLPRSQAREESLFRAGQTEGLSGGADLVGFLPVDDARFCIR